MSNESTQLINQIKARIKAASNILVLVASGSNLDSIAAGLAIKEFLTKLDKNIKVLSVTPLLPKLNFLPQSNQIQEAQNLSKNMVIEVGLGKTQLSELSYQKQGDNLKIFLIPKSGEFDSKDVNVKNAVYPFDLIITLGTANLEELGQFYSTHAPMFFDIPVLNIDYRAANENYGQINLINLTSSAVSEVVFDLLNDFDPNFIDDKVATLLLAGLIFQTNSFQSPKTSPQVFLKASKLVSLGGKQQEIISHLYRSKSLGLLHLWGRVLARLKQDTDNQLVYSAVSVQDIERSNATTQDIDEIIVEMMQQLSFAKYFVFLVESSTETLVYIAGSSPVDFGSSFATYQPQSIASGASKFIVPKNLTITENEVIGAIQNELAKYRT